MHRLDVPRTVIRGIFDAVGQDAAGVTRKDPVEIVRVGIKDAGTALPEQARFARDVILHIRMLVLADVILLEVRENAVIEHNAVDARHLQSLRTDFHHDRLQAGVRHLREILLHDPGLGRRVLRGDMLAAADDLDRSDQAAGNLRVLEDVADHVSRRGLTLRAGNADRDQAFRGIFEPGCRDHRERVTRILHPKDRHVIRDQVVGVVRGHESRRSGLQDLRNVVVTVRDRTRNADKERAGAGFPRVVCDRFDRAADVALQELVFVDAHVNDQFRQCFHK